MIDINDVTRVEVIDHTGRAYVSMHVKGVSLSLQDDEKTLKVFVKDSCSSDHNPRSYY